MNAYDGIVDPNPLTLTTEEAFANQMTGGMIARNHMFTSNKRSIAVLEDFTFMNRETRPSFPPIGTVESVGSQGTMQLQTVQGQAMANQMIQTQSTIGTTMQGTTMQGPTMQGPTMQRQKKQRQTIYQTV